ncbi:kinase, PfkB family [Ancylostoma caninum]|uniref:Kinase, PfkB family n=1 Tax=Ancylostoma caninum TaxID=29170 RepID=A0A368H5K0_ANCCA|nr:kinase, PfkB family [Ancylostoma caninum]
MTPTPYVYPPKDQPRIIFLGGIISPDLTCLPERLPGQPTFGCHGGKRNNQTVAAARLGGAVTTVGTIPDDYWCYDNSQSSKENTESTNGVEKLIPGEEKTAVSQDEIFTTYLTYFLKDADVCVTHATICGEVNKKSLELAKSKGVLTILNPASSTDKCEDRSLLSLIDLFYVNQLGASNITEKLLEDIESAKAAALDIQEMGPKRVVISLGADGCVFTTSKGDAEHVPCTKCGEVVDTTGAGDCFFGSLVYLVGKVRHDRSPADSEYSCLDDDNLRQAVRRAAFAASISVTEEGGNRSYWRREEILQKYPDFFKS